MVVSLRSTIHAEKCSWERESRHEVSTCFFLGGGGSGEVKLRVNIRGDIQVLFCYH